MLKSFISSTPTRFCFQFSIKILFPQHELLLAKITEKINGTRNEYHIVNQDQYPIYDGIHEAIVSVEDWELAQQKRKKLGVKREKIYNLDHEHLLSGLLRCPVCGAVEEVIERLVSNPEFEKALCEKINTRVSTKALEEELAVFKK